jgi:hypothetical protein
MFSHTAAVVKPWLGNLGRAEDLFVARRIKANQKCFATPDHRCPQIASRPQQQPTQRGLIGALFLQIQVH